MTYIGVIAEIVMGDNREVVDTSMDDRILFYPISFWKCLYPGTYTVIVTYKKEQCPRPWLRVIRFGDTVLLGLLL